MTNRVAKTHAELCEHYDVKPLNGETIGAALFRELQNELRNAICFPTHRLPANIQNRKLKKTVQELDDELEQGFRVPSMSLSEIQERI